MNSKFSIETVSGNYVDPTNVNVDALSLNDIAWSLSRISRFAGHTITEVPYNVADHSVFVADMILKGGWDLKVAMFGLLHDAAEAYIGDIPSPVKKIPTIHKALEEIEGKILDTIYMKFLGFLPTAKEWDIVKSYDRKACQIEAFHFMPSRGKGWENANPLDLVELQSFPPPDNSLSSYARFMTWYKDHMDKEKTRDAEIFPLNSTSYQYTLTF